MIQVSTQAELQDALTSGEKDIEVTDNFYIDALQEITYAVTITSAEGGPYTLAKAESYNQSLFVVINNGSLTLENIILDGAMEAHPSASGAAALIMVLYGTLVLDTGSVLQINNGKGIYISDSSAPIMVLIKNNATIRENQFNSSNGEGIGFIGEKSLIIDGDVKISRNQANSGGLYSSNSTPGTGQIKIGDDSRFMSNTATDGGGIYKLDQRILNLTGVAFSQNTAARGEDIFNGNTFQIGPKITAPAGLYLENASAVPTITQHFTDDSVIQLEQGGYLSPNQEGNPIVAAQAGFVLTGEDFAVFKRPDTGFDGWKLRLSDDNFQVLLEPVVYEIEYENTMGVENPNPRSFTVVTPTITLADLPDTADFHFAGWFDSPEGGSQVTEIPAGSTGDKVFYARWQVIEYTVTYYGNDAGGSEVENLPQPQKAPAGESVLLSEEIPIRSGYAFIGWNSDPLGTGTAYFPGGTISNIRADTSLYAQWQRVEHILTYHGNDEAEPPAQWIPYPQMVPEGAVITLSDVIPTREGYRFTSWNTQPNGGGDTYQPGASFGPVFSDANLYAQWAALPPNMHTLTYYGNDAGGPDAQNIPSPVLVPDGQTVELSTMLPTRKGYIFSGWNTEPAGSGTAYQPGDSIPDIQMDIDLYAQWIPLPEPVNYTLTYCGNDAGGPPACCVPSTQQVPAGKYVQISCCAPRRSCYRFEGWNTNRCGTGRMYRPGQIIGPVTGDTWIYAQWKRISQPKTRYFCCSDPN